MAIEVFNRYENKYLLNEKTFDILQHRLTDYMELDAYNKKHDTYPIANIYYDTHDDYLIRTSISKPKYKEKLRIRAYGVPNADSKVYVEIKKKVAGLVNKRRTAMTLADAYNFLENGKVSELKQGMNKQVVSEIEYMLSVHNLKPAVYLSYDRRAYFGADSDDVRISFDTNIQTRRTDIKFESGMYGQQLLQEGKWLMEIKVHNNIPYWLSSLLSEYQIYPTSFSKYGTEYKQTKRSEPQCLNHYLQLPQKQLSPSKIFSPLSGALLG